MITNMNIVDIYKELMRNAHAWCEMDAIKKEIHFWSKSLDNSLSIIIEMSKFGDNINMEYQPYGDIGTPVYKLTLKL